MDRIQRFTEGRDALMARLRQRGWKLWLLVFLAGLFVEELITNVFVQSTTSLMRILGGILWVFANQRMGIGGIALVGWAGLLLGLSYWETRPRKLDPPTKEARALEAELAEKDRQLRQHIEAMRYGSNLLHAEPLTPADQRALSEPMRELRPFVDRASEGIRALLLVLLHDLRWANPENPQRDARYWLAMEIQENVLNRITRMQERFDRVVEADEDAREALAGFFEWYQAGERWARAMGTFLSKPIDDTEEHSKWKECDKQLTSIVKEKFSLPQFSSVQGFLQSHSRLEAIMLEGLPAGLDRRELDT